MTESETGQRQFVEDFGLLLSEAGMPRMAARAFAAIICDDAAALSARELGERLRVSPAAISGAVRYLIQVGMVRKTRQAGARVDQYALGSDTWYELFAARDPMLRQWEQTFADGAARLNAGPGAERLRASQEFFAFLRQELGGILQRWHERQPPA